MVEASMNIGIFVDDRAIFDQAVKMWRERVPAYAYIAADGPTPNPPPRGNKTGSRSAQPPPRITSTGRP